MSKKELVVKSNQVIEASYRLSVTEQRVLLSAIAKIPKQVEVSDDVIYTVNVQDLNKIGIHEKASYRELKLAVDRLYERSINFIDGTTSKIRWVQRIDFNDSKSEIAIRFSKDILPYISNVKENFTQYLLSDVATMKSAYSFRLYELLAQYKNIGKRLIGIDDLRLMLVVGKKYKTTGNFIAWVVEPSLKEINQVTNLTVSVEPKKTGRKYTHLEFIIKVKDNPTAQASQRDEKTGDLFSIENMSDKQIQMFSKKLAELAELGSKYCPVGASTEQFAQMIASELKNPLLQVKYIDYLKKLGFKSK